MNNSNTGYMVIPMGLTIEQREVYTYLYARCNFQDMTVKYTVSQIVASADKRLNITTKKVRNILKILSSNGYITDIFKGSKGKPSILKITKLLDCERANNGQIKGNYRANKIAQPSHLEEVKDNYRANNGQIKGNPIKEKENNIYSENILKAIAKYPGKKVKSVRDKKLPSLIKKYSEEQIIRCIDRYLEECKGKDKQYILNESTFWNGRYEDYLDENYLDKQEPTKTIRREDRKMKFYEVF